MQLPVTTQYASACCIRHGSKRIVAEMNQVEEAVTEGNSLSRTTAIPLLEDNELRLAKMRTQLEDMFRSLRLVHDELTICSGSARSEGLTELANVLSLCVCNAVFGQLKSLTNIIERLGGRTALSEHESLERERVNEGGTKS